MEKANNTIKKKRGRKPKNHDFDDYRKPFPARLRGMIESNDVTHETVAKAIGVTRQAVGKWANGETIPDVESAVKIADFFHVSTDYLLCRTNVQSIDNKMKAAHDVTGLSEDALDALQLITVGDDKALQIINAIIADDEFSELIRCSKDFLEILDVEKGQISIVMFQDEMVRLEETERFIKQHPNELRYIGYEVVKPDIQKELRMKTISDIIRKMLEKCSHDSAVSELLKYGLTKEDAEHTVLQQETNQPQSDNTAILDEMGKRLREVELKKEANEQLYGTTEHTPTNPQDK